jgi:hypothetical protein
VAENPIFPAVPTSARDEVRATLRLDRYQLWLIILFVLSLAFVNPWIHGDGVGYYAYARALLIEHRLDFRKDWLHANQSFVMGREDLNGHLLHSQFTRTGHLRNLWTVGPSMLWAPFLLVAHAGVLAADHLGAHIPPDGFSKPYRTAMALATAFYGFLGLWISFTLARKYFDEKWAFLATLGIWFGSSLPVYMYFNPSWSHALSAFVVALFIGYWHRTRKDRSFSQWLLLGLISGLMVDVYYPNGALLLLPLIEAVRQYASAFKSTPDRGVGRVLAFHVLYSAALLTALLPTLISRHAIFGAFLQTGYYSAHLWNWSSPSFWSVLFSSDHGLLTWTPILIFALLGLVFLRRADRPFASKLIVCCVAFYLLIAFYPDWDGLSSFGNRFFISLTPIFILGLAALFERLARAWSARAAWLLAAAATAILILWNFGMMYQWGMHLIPVRGPISWREATYNQFAVVPKDATRTLERYLERRGELMRYIEEKDVKQLESQSKGSQSQ